MIPRHAFPLVALLLSALPAGSDEGDAQGGETAPHAFEAAGVRIVHPWVNATTGREALFFLELENAGSGAVTLEGARVPFAEAAELVGFVMEGGVGRYQALPGVPVQPGRSLDLAPEALAIRATGLTRTLDEGEAVEITLRTSAGDIPLLVAVEPETALQHSHAGHAH